MIKGLNCIDFIKKQIIHLKFDTQADLCKTFLRFQEYYESPKFKNKYFTLNEIKIDYKGNTNKKFTYYTDWVGFNIPSKILKPFREGKFGELSTREKSFLKIFDYFKGKYYIIGTCVDDDEYTITLNHELVHAVYYLNSEYRKKVKKIISEYPFVNSLKTYLEHRGYHKSTFHDEINAYLATGENITKKETDSNCYLTLQKNLKILFNQYKSLYIK